MTHNRQAGSGVTVPLLLQLIVPVLWLGMVIAISFIEAPLKFTAPGITLELGLGIGRLVFAALNIAEAILLVVLVVVSFWSGLSRVVGARLWWVLVILMTLVLKIAVRIPLNERTNQVLAGTDDGGSSWHLIYIGLEGVLVVSLIVFIVLTGRTLLRGDPKPSEVAGP